MNQIYPISLKRFEKFVYDFFAKLSTNCIKIMSQNETRKKTLGAPLCHKTLTYIARNNVLWQKKIH